jgi:hypothetical protein
VSHNEEYPQPNIELLATLRQGDHLPLLRIPILGDDGDVTWKETPEGVAIISQTCDIVREGPPRLLVAPLVKLDGQIAAEARSGRRSQYVEVPSGGTDAFVDLDGVAALMKSNPILAQANRTLFADEDIRRFSWAVGRRFSRFAFPDEIVPWFQPLTDVVKKKYSRPESAEGKLFNRVAQFRIEAAGGWTEPPYSLTLVIILEPGELPHLDDDEIADVPTDILALQRPDQIANSLIGETDPYRRYWLWLRLGDAWAAMCYPMDKYLKSKSDSERRAVNAAVENGLIEAEVLSADEYTLNRIQRSELLDLDYLSPPPLSAAESGKAEALVATVESVRALSQEFRGQEKHSRSIRALWGGLIRLLRR